MTQQVPPNVLRWLSPAGDRAYSSAEKQCGGGQVWKIDGRATARPLATAAPTTTTAGVVKMYIETSFISRAVIFFRKYSGVRPTIRPATKTVMTASTNMP